MPLDASDAPPPPPRSLLVASEDYWAIWLGVAVLLVLLASAWWSRPEDHAQQVQRFQALEAAATEPTLSDPQREQIAKEQQELTRQIAPSPLAGWLGKIGSWKSNPAVALQDKQGNSLVVRLLVVLGVCLLLFGTARFAMTGQLGGFPLAFAALFALATLAFLMAGQVVVKHYNLEYALWALLVGLAISNTVGTPAWLRPALQTELYIKTGLVLLGAEIVLQKLLALGLPGVFIAWIVTPVVLVSTYWFGQRVLRIPSRSLNMVISADMSVCGVSAAIATASACRAKKEELSLAIGMSLGFTVVMMVVMPPVIRFLELGEVVGGAWIGGTIDSTGAVAAAGGMLGDTALAAAVTIKMIQNILIGVVAFAVAVYWVGWVEPSGQSQRPDIREVWRRFPKFVLGFVAASLLFSALAASGVSGQALTSSVTSGSVVLRGWLFCLAFVSIGLDSNFRELARQLSGGKPLILYLCGQTLNLTLTLLMAWWMFEKVFPHAADALAN